MLEKGRLDGQRVWKRVLAAVKEIQREERRDGERPIQMVFDFRRELEELEQDAA